MACMKADGGNCSGAAKVHFHLPGLFEFDSFYEVFLPLFRERREFFYPWCDIGSVYGAPADCLWGGGRCGFGEADAEEALALVDAHGISPRLTFSNSLLRAEHLSDRKCNALCRTFSKASAGGGAIVHSDLLARYLAEKYPDLYLVSSTTKVLTEFADFEAELRRDEFSFVVPDFRLNKSFGSLGALPRELKDKVEFLCNECCPVTCARRKACYESVSRKNLGERDDGHRCAGGEYKFSRAMRSPAFIGVGDIVGKYVPMGFSNFKIEGRGLGSAVLLEFILHYMTRPERQLEVREAVYLDSSLDLF